MVERRFACPDRGDGRARQAYVRRVAQSTDVRWSGPGCAGGARPGARPGLRRRAQRALAATLLAAGTTLLVVALPATPAAAQPVTQCFSDDVPENTTNWQEVLSVAQFDPSLGTLLDATFTSSAASTQQTRGENTSQANGDFTVVSTTDVAPLSIAIGTPVSVQLAFDSGPFTLPPFDGSLDNAGASSRTFDPISDADSSSELFSDATSLAAVTGLGPLDYEVRAFVSTQVTNRGGNFRVEQSTVASYGIEICYRYEALQTTTTTTVATAPTTTPGASTSPSTGPPSASSSPPVTGASAPPASPSSMGGAPAGETPVLPATGESPTAQALLALTLVGAGAILLSPRSARGGTGSSRTR